MTVGGVVLAGGLSRRMGGGDKGLLELGGVPLLRRVIDRIAPQVDALALNANGDAARFADYDLPVIADSLPDHPGPLAGVLAGMDWAAERGIAQLVSVAADTPFFPPRLVTGLRMGAVAAERPLAMAVTEEAGRVIRHPTFTLWPVDLREDLRAALGAGVRKVVIWTDRHGCAEVMFHSDGVDPFFNVNTPEDMVQAQTLIEAGQG
ncbi:MAG: molybdenum cofactor guanylyltransferase MobA [Pseudomonadota bacterium]